MKNKLATAIIKGYNYDPGDSDLDNEQPISVQMTLGDYRRAVSEQVYEVNVNNYPCSCDDEPSYDDPQGILRRDRDAEVDSRNWDPEAGDPPENPKL